MTLSRFPLPSALCALLMGAGSALAQAPAQSPSQTLHVRALAATCANCHGTDGRAVAGSGNVSLQGLERAYFLEQMAAFRDGKRPATVMHQLTKGYSQEQIEQLATYFAAQK